ncbi:MAG: type II toxin-antitoxin system VapC family toxin [Terriglobales bacterium]
MTRVYWDTMLFIYWMEDNRELQSRVEAIYESMRNRGHRLCASLFTACEVMVYPCRRDDSAAARRIEEFFASPEVEMLPLTPAVIPRYGHLRAGASVGAMDALHLAIAAAASVNLFLTNDRRLHRLKIPGIDFIAGLDVPFY